MTVLKVISRLRPHQVAAGEIVVTEVYSNIFNQTSLFGVHVCVCSWIVRLQYIQTFCINSVLKAVCKQNISQCRFCSCSGKYVHRVTVCSCCFCIYTLGLNIFRLCGEANCLLFPCCTKFLYTITKQRNETKRVSI